MPFGKPGAGAGMGGAAAAAATVASCLQLSKKCKRPGARLAPAFIQGQHLLTKACKVAGLHQAGVAYGAGSTNSAAERLQAHAASVKKAASLRQDIRDIMAAGKHLRQWETPYAAAYAVNSIASEVKGASLARLSGGKGRPRGPQPAWQLATVGVLLCSGPDTLAVRQARDGAAAAAEPAAAATAAAAAAVAAQQPAEDVPMDVQAPELQLGQLAVAVVEQLVREAMAQLQLAAAPMAQHVPAVAEPEPAPARVAAPVLELETAAEVTRSMPTALPEPVPMPVADLPLPPPGKAEALEVDSEAAPVMAEAVASTTPEAAPGVCEAVLLLPPGPPAVPVEHLPEAPEAATVLQPELEFEAPAWGTRVLSMELETTDELRPVPVAALVGVPSLPVELPAAPETVVELPGSPVPAPVPVAVMEPPGARGTVAVPVGAAPVLVMNQPAPEAVQEELPVGPVTLVGPQPAAPVIVLAPAPRAVPAAAVPLAAAVLREQLAVHEAMAQLAAAPMPAPAPAPAPAAVASVSMMQPLPFLPVAAMAPAQAAPTGSEVEPEVSVGHAVVCLSLEAASEALLAPVRVMELAPLTGMDAAARPPLSMEWLPAAVVRLLPAAPVVAGLVCKVRVAVPELTSVAAFSLVANPLFQPEVPAPHGQGRPAESLAARTAAAAAAAAAAELVPQAACATGRANPRLACCAPERKAAPVLQQLMGEDAAAQLAALTDAPTLAREAAAAPAATPGTAAELAGGGDGAQRLAPRLDVLQLHLVVEAMRQTQEVLEAAELAGPVEVPGTTLVAPQAETAGVTGNQLVSEALGVPLRGLTLAHAALFLDAELERLGAAPPEVAAVAAPNLLVEETVAELPTADMASTVDEKAVLLVAAVHEARLPVASCPAAAAPAPLQPSASASPLQTAPRTASVAAAPSRSHVAQLRAAHEAAVAGARHTREHRSYEPSAIQVEMGERGTAKLFERYPIEHQGRLLNFFTDVEHVRSSSGGGGGWGSNSRSVRSGISSGGSSGGSGGHSRGGSSGSSSSGGGSSSDGNSTPRGGSSSPFITGSLLSAAACACMLGGSSRGRSSGCVSSAGSSEIGDQDTSMDGVGGADVVGGSGSELPGFALKDLNKGCLTRAAHLQSLVSKLGAAAGTSSDGSDGSDAVGLQLQAAIADAVATMECIPTQMLYDASAGMPASTELHELQRASVALGGAGGAAIVALLDRSAAGVSRQQAVVCSLQRGGSRDGSSSSSGAECSLQAYSAALASLEGLQASHTLLRHWLLASGLVLMQRTHSVARSLDAACCRIVDRLAAEAGHIDAELRVGLEAKAA